jgi:hypothetical protein
MAKMPPIKTPAANKKKISGKANNPKKQKKKYRRKQCLSV